MKVFFTQVKIIHCLQVRQRKCDFDLNMCLITLGSRVGCQSTACLAGGDIKEL